MNSLPLIDRPSPNNDARSPGRVVDMLVLHYTGMEDAQSALDRLCDPEAAVSAHYLIDEEGGIHRLVPEARRGGMSWRSTMSRASSSSAIIWCSVKGR